MKRTPPPVWTAFLLIEGRHYLPPLFLITGLLRKELSRTLLAINSSSSTDRMYSLTLRFFLDCFSTSFHMRFGNLTERRFVGSHIGRPLFALAISINYSYIKCVQQILLPLRLKTILFNEIVKVVFSNPITLVYFNCLQLTKFD